MKEDTVWLTQLQFAELYQTTKTNISEHAYYDRDEEIVRMGDAPCVYTTPDVILQWIQEGKPRETSWWSESAKEEPEFGALL